MHINPGNFKIFRSLFCGRTDVHAKLWSNQNGQSGYSPVYTKDRKLKPLNDVVLLSHLLGMETVGVYPLMPDNTAHFLAIDFDKGSWFEEAQFLIKTADRFEVPAYLERSKSGLGGHVWIFFKHKIPSWKARLLGKNLLHKSKISRKFSYDRMFPSQDRHTGKGFGNLIALPLQGKFSMGGNTVFIDENGEVYDDQWKFLSNIKKLNHSEVDRILKRFSNTEEITEVEEPIIQTKETSHTKLIFSNNISISQDFLPTDLYTFIRSKVNFPNPQFYELERRGFSTWNTSRMIINLETTDGVLLIPRGFLPGIENFCKSYDIKVEIDDRRILTKKISFKSSLELRSYQKNVVKSLLKEDQIILEAKPGFGKTMVALYCILKRKQPTLIVVHTKALLYQWQKRIEDCFDLEKGDIGIVGNQKWNIGNKITIASYQTLARRGIDEIKNEFGFVIIDECHHVPAKTFTDVVKKLSAKYILGLTATAFRRDKLDKLMTLYVGPILKSDDKSFIKDDKTKLMPTVPTILKLRSTDFQLNSGLNSNFHEIGDRLLCNDNRNNLILNDVIEALNMGGKCLVLSERVEHCQLLLDLIRQKVKGLHAATVSGKMTRKERDKLIKRMKQPRFRLLLATGKLIGEGFDWPELTHLFLT
ncbi:hypothetical protein AUK45_05225 [Candidatus Peregrinibacteria bacterium CG2_30_44_17]|nr:MAG: hypothetical protein AUK45_05225 [Candidatus Peregrinibacteria bacterium CG2_30_44_17]